MRSLPKARFHRTIFDPKDMIHERQPKVLICGRSNVGKSSLINHLAGLAGLARVSRTPGKTRALNLFMLDERFILVDLPGYGYAKRSRSEIAEWEIVLTSLFKPDWGIKGILLLIDIRRGFCEADWHLLSLAAPLDIPLIVVLTKSDELSQSERVAAQRDMVSQTGLVADDVVVYSIREAVGRDRLLRALIAHGWLTGE